MPFIPTVGGVKMDLAYDIQGVPAHNIFWVDVNAEVTFTNIQTAMSGVITWVEDYLATVLSTEVDIISLTGTDGEHAEGTQIVHVFDPVVSGEIAANVSSTNVACVVSLRSGQTGRSARGRMYIPGLAESDILVNTIGATRLAAIAAVMAQLIEGINTVDPQHFLAINSFYTNNAPRAAGRMLNVTTAIVNSTIGTIRNRVK